MGAGLTAAFVASVKPNSDRQVEYRDDKQPGLSLRVSPGGKKSWTMRYRTHAGEQRRLTLGQHPAVTLSQARDLARKATALVADGEDPANDRKQAKIAARAKQVSTVSALVESYFEDAARGRHKPNGTPKRSTTLNMERQYYDRLVKPRFGSMPVSDLTRNDVQRFLDTVGDKAPSTARQCRNVLRQAYNYGIRREVVDKNPAQLVNLPKVNSRDRVLSDDEVRAIWDGASDPDSFEDLNMSPLMGLALCLAMVTLQRGGEVIGIHAHELDRENRLWTIPGSRTKNRRTHVVPLSDLSLQILDQAFLLSNAMATNADSHSTGHWNGYAFASEGGDGPMTRHALSRAMKRLTTELGIEDATAHDFRRTGATNITGERVGMSRFIVSRVLNQISDTGGAAVVTGVYDRNEYLAEKRKALDAWSGLLREIAEGQPTRSNIVRFSGS